MRPRLLKKAQVQGGRRREARGVLGAYAAAPHEPDNAADGPFSAACCSAISVLPDAPQKPRAQLLELALHRGDDLLGGHVEAGQAFAIVVCLVVLVPLRAAAAPLGLGGGQVPVETGEMDVTVSVDVRFALQ